MKPLIFGAGSQGGQDDVDESRLNDLAWLRAQLSAEKNWYDAQRGAKLMYGGSLVYLLEALSTYSPSHPYTHCLDQDCFNAPIAVEVAAGL